MSKNNAKKIVLTQQEWLQEKNTDYLCHKLAKRESKRNRELLDNTAAAAVQQAKKYEAEIEALGESIPTYHPAMRLRMISFIIKLFGPRQARSILISTKLPRLSAYINSQTGHPWPIKIEDIGRGHKSLSTSNNLRAAVFGINDGLVSNASLIMGMAGAQVESKIIIVAGIAGLLAGAFSMGAGEYISVKSQREMFEYQIGIEKKELELYPKEETEELALIYQARGLPKEEAEKVAALLMKDPASALGVHAREELGINPDDLVSPYNAAFFSFIFFTLGAAIPLLPFIIDKTSNSTTLFTAIGLTGLCLFVVGATLNLYTGRNAIKSGLRMLCIGAVAGGITYLTGHLLGVQLS